MEFTVQFIEIETTEQTLQIVFFVLATASSSQNHQEHSIVTSVRSQGKNKG
jgi:hypothetical protein